MTRIKPNVKAISKPFSLVPAVDVFFLLLVPFMISSSVTFWPGSKVDTEVRLPKARVRSLSVADKLIVTVTSSGDLFFNSKPMANIEELEAELRELLRQSATPAGETQPPTTPGRRPMIGLRADHRNTYGRIVQILSLGRELNVDVYQMVDPGGTDKSPPPVLENDD